MALSPYAHFDVPEIINCVGYATRVGGSCPSENVLQSMSEANRAYVEIDDLQAAASRLIARCTGAEAGIVTCGAAAALTLGAAACLAGSDTDRMDRLPDTTGFVRDQIIYPSAADYDYDHALRTSGAKLVEIDYRANDALEKIESAIGPKTAAIGYAWYHVDERPEISRLAELAHRHGLPLLVDGAMSLPPTENLRRFVSLGADLVAFSGGKHLGGPQGSGLLCGRKDLIRSAWVQMVDMDVRAVSWSLRQWVDEGWIDRPPRHGIGRSMKVGKEIIVGLMYALEAYGDRDHAAELATWKAISDEIEADLSGISGLRVTSLASGTTGQPFPTVQIDLDKEALGCDMDDLHKGLRECRPKVVLAEDTSDPGRAYIYPMCLRSDDPKRIVGAFEHVIRKCGDVHRDDEGIS